MIIQMSMVMNNHRNPEVDFLLGTLYELGLGTLCDYKEAAWILSIAMEVGHAEASIV